MYKVRALGIKVLMILSEYFVFIWIKQDQLWNKIHNNLQQAKK